MDAQDHKKNALSEQEIHSVQCHKCGWPFPNPHPSAKHRRAHKRVCGTIEGYKLLDSGSDHSNFAGSDNEHISDDDRRNPSPKRSIKGSANSGGMGLKPNQSEDELFSDAIPHFSNNGANQSLDKNVEGGKVYHVLKDSHVSKDEKTAGTSQPPHGLTELLQGSIKAGEMSDYAVMRGETNQSQITNSVSDIGNEKVLDVVSGRPWLESNSSIAISELIVVSESFHDTTEFTVVADNNKTDCETGKRSSSLGPCIKDNEKGDEANEDVHCTTTSEVLQSDRKLEIEPTSGPLELEATTTKVEKETLDPQVQSDSQLKLNNVNVETSHARIVDETANQEEVLANDLQFKYDASSRTKHRELRDALSVSEPESDSPEKSIYCSPGLSNEVRDMEEAGNESTPFLSPAETFVEEENSVDMIGDFKDYEMLKSGASLDLRADEEERSSKNDKKIPILENFQDALSKLPDGNADWSSSNPLESKVEKQHVSTPDSGTVFISTTQNVQSTTANVFAGTMDEPKEESVSAPIDGEVGTAVPDLPSAQSSVHTENVAYTSEKVSNLQNSQNAVSNVSAGTVDNSSTPIDRETSVAVPENLSSVPYGTEGNSSLDTLQDDLKKVGTSTLIGGGTSVTANIICPSSSMSTGTSDEFLLDNLEDDLKNEGVSTSVSVEFIPPVPPVATEDSKVPAGTLENITSEAMDDDLQKNSVSIPINGDANTSLQGNLPITNSSVRVRAVDNSASEPVADDLRKEVVSEPNDGEAGASAREDLKGALSNIPVVGSSDNILSEALEDDHKEEGFSTLHEKDVGTSVPDNLPRVLSSVPAGTTDNSSNEPSKDALSKEGVLTHDFEEVGSSGFRETSGEDDQLLPLTATLPSVKNPEAMIGDFEDHKVSKSGFTFDVGADEEIKLAEDDKKVTVSENPIALKDVPAGNIDNSLSVNLEDDFKKEGVSIPIHGEVGAFGFMGTTDEESHLLSVGDTTPTVVNPEALIEEFKDYNVLKSSFSMDLGAAEETISRENDKKVTAPENLPSSVSSGLPSGSIDSSPSDALEDDLRKEGVSIPIYGEIDASEFKFNNDVGFGSSTHGNSLKSPNCEANNSEPNNNAERSLTQSIDGKSMPNEDSEPASRQESDVVPLESSTGEQNLQMVILCGSGNANNQGYDKLVPVAPGNDNVQPGDEPSAGDSTTLAQVEAIPETILLVGNQSLGLENSSMGFSSIADNGTVEVSTEERLANQSHPTPESSQQLVSSNCLDDASISHHMNVEAGASGIFCNSSESLRHSDEILHNSEGLKMGEETKVSNLSRAPEIVSELKYEDPTQRSEQTPEGSNLKGVATLATESQNIRGSAISGPSQDHVDENITKPNPSILAVDNFIVSSSRTDSLEGNWGSISEAMDDDLKKNRVSIPINGDANTSLQENLPITNSSVLVGAVDNSASQPVADDLRKEVVSEPGDGEASASAHEDLNGALSNIPVVGSSDNILSEALEDDHEEEGFSTLHDRDVGTSDPDNLPCVLSSVPAGTADNSSKEASKDALTKEVVLTHDFVEVGSLGFRETSGEDNQFLPLAATLPSVKNPEAMIGDFKDHKVLKSSFTFDVGADEEIKLAEDDKKVTVSENPIALKDVPDGNIDNLEDDFKKEGVSIPIHGEVGSFGFMGTTDDESHLLSVADTSPTVDNPEVLIEEFKDYKVLKSSFSMDCGASEEIISLENDKKVTAPENLPIAVSSGLPSGSIDSSPSDALEDDLRKEGVSIPIDGEIDASEFKFNNDVGFGSSSLGNSLKTPNCEANNSERYNNAERSLTRSIDEKSMQNEVSEPASRQQSDVVPIESSTGEQDLQMVKLCGGGNANNHGDDKLVHVVPGNVNVQPGDEPSAGDSTRMAQLEAIPETILLVRNQSLGLENSSIGFSSIADNGTVEVTTEERLANQSHPTFESSRHLVSSDCLDDAGISPHMNVEAGASGKFCNSSESLRHTDEILHNSGGLKMGEETKVSNLSSAPEIVSELKYEGPTQRSEQIPEGSNLKEVAALAIESQNIREPAILGPSQDHVDENNTKPNPSILAVDNFIVSSSRTDSLEGNWGSVSVLSTQSDVGNVVDAEILSSTDTQSAEKLFKKPEKGKEAAMESHLDKSDVFEPPSFMTLVESKSEAVEKAGWFPSITNVVNESEGRKKNEEIISKVTNWSTAGKQHRPLKNLLNEAHAETKVKLLSPNSKQLVPAVNNQADETASASKNNGIPQTATTTTTTTVSSILGSEMPSSADTVKKEIEKEWNSPARYPIQMKKEKRKGKPYWVPFVCCTSMQQDV